MSIKLTVEFDNMADALDFMQGQLDKPTTSKPAASKTAKAKPGKPAAEAKPAPTSPVREAVTAAGPSTAPDVSDVGFRTWIEGVATPQSLPTLQAMLTARKVQKGSDLTAEQRVQFINEFTQQGAA
jgi:hypothetical protein